MRILGILAACAAAALLCARPALATEVLFDGAGFMQGQQSFEDSFALNGPGTLTDHVTITVTAVTADTLVLTPGTPVPLSQ